MTQLTEADYEIDMEALMGALGIDPGTVVADTAKLQFTQGKALLTYTAMRAVTPGHLAAGLLRSVRAVAAQGEPAETDPDGGNPEPVTPIKKPANRQGARNTRKQTAKKVAKKVAK